MPRHWGVALGAVVLAWEVFALRTGRHTWTDHVEDANLVAAAPLLVFCGWLAQHLTKALLDGPSYPHRH